jgi:ATP-dependent RNA helicase DeaD
MADEARTVPQTTQRYYLLQEFAKVAALSLLLEVEEIKSALIFTRTRVGAAELAETLVARGYPAEALHGDLSQAARETVLRRFRSGRVTLLVCTDVGARGLDIADVSHVVNFDMPFEVTDYVHRIGRTGRAAVGRSADAGDSVRAPPAAGNRNFYQAADNSRYITESGRGGSTARCPFQAPSRRYLSREQFAP